jgi:hypothetical protein
MRTLSHSVALLSVLLASSAASAVVIIPPVEISGLVHRSVLDDLWRPSKRYLGDGVGFPPSPKGTYSGPGFTASIQQGDTIVARFQAPSGYRFVVTPAIASLGNAFTFNASWKGAGSGPIRSAYPSTILFENLSGPAPTSTYDLAAVNDTGNWIYAYREFTFDAAFSFTAIQLSFTAAPTLPGLPITYGPVQSGSTWAFLASSAVDLDHYDQTIMSIEPVPVPATGALGVVGLAWIVLRRRRMCQPQAR